MDDWQWWLAYGVIAVSMAGGFAFALFALYCIFEGMFKGIRSYVRGDDYDWEDYK